MGKAIEKLEQIIEEQEEKIQELEEKLETLERWKQWTIPRLVDEKKMIKQGYNNYNKLPLPRLEMRINPLSEDWYKIEWIYGLVYKHFTGDIIFIPFGQTIGSGNNDKIKTEFSTPFRDGLHIKTEMQLLNLPGYLLCDGTIKTIDEVQNNCYSVETLTTAMKDMKR